MATAKLKLMRASALKVRRIARLVRGHPVKRAQAILSHLPTPTSKPLARLLKSAVANAVENDNLHEDDLYLTSFLVDQGPKMKRFRPRSRGMAHPYTKQLCHVTLVVSPKTETTLNEETA